MIPSRSLIAPSHTPIIISKFPFSSHFHPQTSAQYSASRKNVGIFGLKHEVFFLNLEDGYFGCQVNESTDYLQLYELSKLCDGTSDCYMGSDELRNKLKCTSKYPLKLPC